MQLIAWPQDFVDGLVEQGYYVIRFDNRDIGLSSKLDHHKKPNVLWAYLKSLVGLRPAAGYTLNDMADDALGLLDALGIGKAHVVGVSMGGQIAQTMAIEHPGRVRSLCSMMSTTGNVAVGQPAPEVLRELFSLAPAETREQAIEQYLRVMRIVGSPGYPADEDELAARAGLAYDRSHDRVATARQAIATVASGDRTERLRQLQLPTLVIHGLADRMCDVSGGRATVDAIPGAKLVLIEGMGHNLPPGLRLQLAAQITEFVWHVEHVSLT